jgi:hypothetical protein
VKEGSNGGTANIGLGAPSRRRALRQRQLNSVEVSRSVMGIKIGVLRRHRRIHGDVKLHFMPTLRMRR